MSSGDNPGTAAAFFIAGEMRITCIRLRESFLYLAVILDTYSRRVVFLRFSWHWRRLNMAYDLGLGSAYDPLQLAS
jgi:hypothetical protein